ncbi:MAG TPA: YggS family pyridoxal phosphate-dependent enzyme, partial [Gammaproteobacteria bacterium]|nr:YggS family pyridoxal phosphate-dependent enzyme [Gammaproteobacteria bacterium]
MPDLSSRHALLSERIQAACKAAQRDPNSVELLAVSKTKPPGLITEAVALGMTQFGENYLQEAVEKIQHLEQLSLAWHFIGRIQSNKCKTIANAFSWVQTLDRSKVAQRLNQFRSVAEPLNVLIQVNLDDDPNKGGVDKQNAEHLLEQVLTLPNLAPRGLMT